MNQKTNENIFCISALASKMGQIIRIMAHCYTNYLLFIFQYDNLHSFFNLTYFTEYTLMWVSLSKKNIRLDSTKILFKWPQLLLCVTLPLLWDTEYYWAKGTKELFEGVGFELGWAHQRWSYNSATAEFITVIGRSVWT